MKTRLTVLAFGRQCRRAALILALLCTVFPLVAQRFEKSFGGPKDDFGQAILQTEDHGYLEVGSTRGQLGDDNDFDIFVVRTDVDGTTIWKRTFDDGFTEQGMEVTQAADGGYMIVGFRKETPSSPEETLLLKLDERGNQVFAKVYGEDGLDEQGQQIIQVPGEGYLITGYRKMAGSSNKQVLAIKVDEDGNVVWRATVGESDDNQGIGAVLGSNGGFIIGANVKKERNPSNDIAFYGLSATGEMLWSKTFGTDTKNEQIEDIIRTSDGNIALVGSTDNFNKAFIAKADLNGDMLWTKEFNPSDFDDELRGVIEEDNGQTLVAVGQTTPSAANFDVLMLKVNATDGQPIWQRFLGSEEAADIGEDLAPTTDGGYALAAFSSSTATVLGNEMVLYKTDDFGATQTNYIVGKVYQPAANDCGSFTEGDLSMNGWLVMAESETTTFFGSTDSLGNYSIRVDSAVYQVSLLRKNDRWEVCNPGPITASLTEPYDSSFIDFALQPAIQSCPLLEVSLSATPAIQCDTQLITVSYGNSGTDIATDAEVRLVLDEALSFLSSSQARRVENNQELIFPLGDLAPNSMGSFNLKVLLACNDLVEGQAISSEVDIFPIFDCGSVDPDWDGSSITVSGRCDLQNGITFRVTNEGSFPMTQRSSYVIVEDILLRTRGEIEILNAAQSTDINIPIDQVDGSTYRMIAEQSPGNPGNLFPTAVVEGCQTNNADFSTGYVAQFPDN
ncbi:MAG: hypothetical protein AAGA31_13275, partial [Bacteroidota bacterium]